MIAQIRISNSVGLVISVFSLQTIFTLIIFFSTLSGHTHGHDVHNTLRLVIYLEGQGQP